jgi:hypothetical protein
MATGCRSSGLEAQLLVDMRVDGEQRIGAEQPCVAVLRRAGDFGRAQVAAGTGAVLDHHRLLQRGLHLLGRQAHHHVAGARRAGRAAPRGWACRASWTAPERGCWRWRPAARWRGHRQVAASGAGHGGVGGGRIRDDCAVRQPRSPVDVRSCFSQATRPGRRTGGRGVPAMAPPRRPGRAVAALQALHQPGAVIGIGAPLARPWAPRCRGCTRSNACSAAASRCRRRSSMSGRWCRGTTPARCSRWPMR